ncbi:MAG: zeta toxin family protein [Chromatiaceae bacterium]|nr:zeta toxin family protein [Chromatiaceae bacterium]
MRDDLYRRWDLPPEEHARVRDQIVEHSLAQTAGVGEDRPTAVILAGQPGAGKSGLQKQAREELRPNGGSVVVNADDLRGYHRHNLGFLDRDDLTAAEKTQHDASRWADELRDAAIAGRRNLIIDGTLKNPENAEHLCARLQGAGYRVEVRALAVPPEDSRLGVYLRYEVPHAKTGSGRWVPETVHDKAVAGFPESLRRIEQRGLAHRVQVYRRGSDQPIYDHLAPCAGDTDGAARIIEAEHHHEPTLDEIRDREAGWNLWHEMARSNGHLEKPYAQRGLALRAQAMKEAQQTRLKIVDARYESVKTASRLDTPETQRLLAESAKAQRENRETIDRVAPDPGPQVKGIGKQGAVGRQKDRDDRFQ